MDEFKKDYQIGYLLGQLAALAGQHMTEDAARQLAIVEKLSELLGFTNKVKKAKK